MDKILTIAAREYKAAVKSKAFLLTMLLMPVFMAGSLVVQILLEKVDVKENRIAVVDRSPGGELGMVLAVSLSDDLAAQPELKKMIEGTFKDNPLVEKFMPDWRKLLEGKNPIREKVAKEIDKAVAEDPELESQVSAIRDFTNLKVRLESVKPSADDMESIQQQRYELSQRVEKGELDGFVEIGADVYKPFTPTKEKPKPLDADRVRMQFKNLMDATKFQILLQQIIDQYVDVRRMQAKKMDPMEVRTLLTPVQVKAVPMTVKNRETGKLEEGRKGAQIINIFLPAALIGLMFMIVMVGATPAMQGIVEEKGARIAEVLLGSVTPFQLMAGKLGGVIGVALTMATVYLLGGYVVAWKYGYADMLSPALMAWFLLFLILALLIYGSLFIAVGAAASDIKDTQTLMMPIMLMATIPFFALNKMMTDPNGMISTAASFLPFGTPMIMVARLSVPPGPPLWQLFVGIAIVLVTTFVCVWAAGRIFRVGILMHGKAPKLKELLTWIVRG